MAAGFSLYSTDSDDLVSSTHHGLDRCVSLMRTLLNSKKQQGMFVGEDQVHTTAHNSDRIPLSAAISSNHGVSQPLHIHSRHCRFKTAPSSIGSWNKNAPRRTGAIQKKGKRKENNTTAETPQTWAKSAVDTRRAQTTRKVTSSSHSEKIMKGAVSQSSSTNSKHFRSKGLLRIPLRSCQVQDKQSHRVQRVRRTPSRAVHGQENNGTRHTGVEASSPPQDSPSPSPTPPSHSAQSEKTTLHPPPSPPPRPSCLSSNPSQPQSYFHYPFWNTWPQYLPWHLMPKPQFAFPPLHQPSSFNPSLPPPPPPPPPHPPLPVLQPSPPVNKIERNREEKMNNVALKDKASTTRVDCGGTDKQVQEKVEDLKGVPTFPLFTTQHPSSFNFFSQPHNPDVLYQYYTNAQQPTLSSIPSFLPNATSSLPSKQTEHACNPVKLPQTEHTGPSHVCKGVAQRDEGNPLVKEMKEVLVCVIEHLENVVSSDGGSESQVIKLVLAHLNNLTQWLSSQSMVPPCFKPPLPFSPYSDANWLSHLHELERSNSDLKVQVAKWKEQSMTQAELLSTRENELCNSQLKVSSLQLHCQSLDSKMTEIKEQVEQLLKENAALQKLAEMREEESSRHLKEASDYHQRISDLQTKINCLQKGREEERERARKEEEESGETLHMVRLSLAEKETELLHCQDKLLLMSAYSDQLGYNCRNLFNILHKSYMFELLHQQHSVQLKGFRQHLAQVLIEVTPMSIPERNITGGWGCLPRHCITKMQQLVNTGTIEGIEDERPTREERKGEILADMCDFSLDDTLSVVSDQSSKILSHKEKQHLSGGGGEVRKEKRVTFTQQEVDDIMLIDASIDNSETDDTESEVLTASRREERRRSGRTGSEVGIGVGRTSGAGSMTTHSTTSSEIEFRRDLAALDADIARLQVHFKVAL